MSRIDRDHPELLLDMLLQVIRGSERLQSGPTCGHFASSSRSPRANLHSHARHAVAPAFEDLAQDVEQVKGWV